MSNYDNPHTPADKVVQMNDIITSRPEEAEMPHIDMLDRTVSFRLSQICTGADEFARRHALMTPMIPLTEDK